VETQECFREVISLPPNGGRPNVKYLENVLQRKLHDARIIYVRDFAKTRTIQTGVGIGLLVSIGASAIGYDAPVVFSEMSRHPAL
jgi:hypothetical protein